MSRLCTICARGGSKGIPGKNKMAIAGHPLIAHSILQAKQTAAFVAIAVSSDDPEILAIGRDYGATLLIERPAELATDQAGKAPAILHALMTAERETGITFEIQVDLDATSPLRNADDILGALRLLETTDASSVITGSKARRSPYFNLVEEAADGSVALSKPGLAVARRQDAPRTFDMNASIYVWRTAVFRAHAAVFYPNTRLFEMPEERSIDIDSPLDLRIVKMLMEQKNG